MMIAAIILTTIASAGESEKAYRRFKTLCWNGGIPTADTQKPNRMVMNSRAEGMKRAMMIAAPPPRRDYS